MESFIQYPILYTSREECLKNENEFEKYNQFPQLIKKDMEGRAWWRLERSFKVPAVFAGIKLETAIKLTSIKQEALLRLYNEYVQDLLHEKLQSSFEAGYRYSFDSSVRGLSMDLYGWNDKF